MSLFDSLVKKAQLKIEEHSKDIAKKLGAMPGNIVNKFETIEQPKAKKVETPKQNRLAREDITKQILAQRDSMLRNGFKEYEFIANKNCCEICAALNGKHFHISKLKIGLNAPPMHSGCRCSIVAYEDTADYEAWLDFLDKGGTTA